MQDFSYPQAYGWLLPRHLTWLRANGVPTSAIIEPEPVRICHGFRAPDGKFEPFPSGPVWFVFVEHDDVIFWRPGTIETATWSGRAYALGESVIDNAATFALGFPLNVYENPLHWLQCKRDGIVIINWDRTFDRLRYCPGIAVVESLREKLKRHLQPPHMPQIFVLRQQEEAAE